MCDSIVLQTEHNVTPSQLFAAGALRLRRSRQVALDFLDRIDDTYGTDEQGYPCSEIKVAIPETSLDLTDEEQAPLHQTIDPLSSSDNYGIELYEQTLHFVHDVFRLHI